MTAGRGPDGRYASQTPADRRDPVPVTCDDCGAGTTGPICRYIRPLPSGETFMGMTLYDHVPAVLCHDCGGRPEGAGHYVCAWCGRGVSYYGVTARPARYCTAACLRSARRARRHEAQELARGQACGTCGAPFTAGRQHARYCSSRCRQQAYRDRRAGQAAERAEDHSIMADYDAQLMSS